MHMYMYVRLYVCMYARQVHGALRRSRGERGVGARRARGYTVNFVWQFVALPPVCLEAWGPDLLLQLVCWLQCRRASIQNGWSLLSKEEWLQMPCGDSTLSLARQFKLITRRCFALWAWVAYGAPTQVGLLPWWGIVLWVGYNREVRCWAQNHVWCGGVREHPF